MRAQSKVPAEFRFLLSCLKQALGLAPPGEEPAQNIDWDTFLRLADSHAVRPLIAVALAGEAIPQRVRSTLEQVVRANAAKNLLYAAELLRLIGHFEAAAVPVATFKGVTLAQSLYGDICLREFCDLDLLVKREDVSRTEAILKSCGYAASFQDPEYRHVFLSHHRQYLFRHQQTGLYVDLHWELPSKGMRFPLRSAEVWQHLELLSLEGRAVPVLCRQDLALYLAAHGAKEGWRSLGWLCDYALLLRKNPDLDWTVLLKRAEQAHCSRVLLLALYLANLLLDAPAPSDLIDRARGDVAVQKMAARAQSNTLRSTPAGEVETFLAGLGSHERLRHRISAIAALLTTRTVSDHRAMPLPKSFWGLYYVTRPFRLTAKAAQFVLQRR